MIIDELNLVSLPFAPLEDDSPLIVDANTVKPSPFSTQHFKPISGWRPEIKQPVRRIDEVQLANRRSDDVRRKLPNSP